MIKLIDLYILKRFIGRIVFLLVAISSIILITNLVEMIDNFIDAEMNSNEIFYYYLYTLPMIISYALPMAITIATVLSILAYIKNKQELENNCKHLFVRECTTTGCYAEYHNICQYCDKWC